MEERVREVLSRRAMQPGSRAPHLSWEPSGLRSSHLALPGNWGCGPAAALHPVWGLGS